MAGDPKLYVLSVPGRMEPVTPTSVPTDDMVLSPISEESVHFVRKLTVPVPVTIPAGEEDAIVT